MTDAPREPIDDLRPDDEGNDAGDAPGDAAPPGDPPTGDAPPPAPDDGKSETDRLIDLAMDLFDFTTSTKTGETVAIRRKGDRTPIRFDERNKAISSELSVEYRLRFGTAPKAQALRSAMHHASGQCVHGTPVDVAFDAEPPKRAAARSQGDRLVDMACERYIFGQSMEGRPFASPAKGPQIALGLKGNQKALLSELRVAYREKYKHIPSSSACADAMSMIESYCLQRPRQPVGLRVARCEDGLVLDLGDETGRCVVIRPGSWSLEDQSPILFKRTNVTMPIPAPAENGDLTLLRPLLNVTDEDFDLLNAWLVSILIPDMEHPILYVNGEQDSGKTNVTRMLRMLVDPTNPRDSPLPRDEDHLAVTSAVRWIFAIQNVSEIKEWLSNAFCNVVDGTGFEKKKLYTDDDVHVNFIWRPITMTAIDLPRLKPDLVRRMLRVDVRPPAKKREKSELWATFESHRPSILAGLLDVAAAALEHLPNVELTDAEKVMMPDFTRVAAAVDQVEGTTSVEHYVSQRSTFAGDLIEGELVAQHIIARLSAHIRDLDARGMDRTDLEFRCGELQKEGKHKYAEESPNSNKSKSLPDGWPANAAAMRSKLKKIMPSLRSHGVDITPPRETDKTRTYRMAALPDFTPVASDTDELLKRLPS